MQSGEIESDISIIASCDICGLPRVCPWKYVVTLELTGVVADLHAVLEAEAELLLSAIVIPFVSPNMLATLTFLRQSVLFATAA